MSNIKTISWKYLEKTNCLIFSSTLELKWAEQAWKFITNIGLANYYNKIERSQVIIRFLALADFYIDFCYHLSGEILEPDYLEWARELGLRQFIIGQIIRCDPSWNPDDQQNECGMALNRLIKNIRPEIIQALLKGFGSESKLFISLYRLRETESELTDEHLVQDYSNQTDQDILLKTKQQNSDGFNWLKNICYQTPQRMKQLTIRVETDEFSLNPEYSLFELVDDTVFKEEYLELLIRTIKRKGQAILNGSPGTGKTFIAEKLAKHLIGGNDGFFELIQFHPAYTYEDFLQGIRPQSQDGQLKYSLVPGRFLEFCQKADTCKGTCVLIIDEINRANLSQVFGELMYLLEYRDREIPLAAGNTFRIPANVLIIGTMNTADRSIALVDHALRRRFAFIEIPPDYDVLRKWHKKNTDFSVDGLIKTLEQLNQAIADKNYEIGISFFLKQNLADELEDIWCMEIEPYLEEYFFNQIDKVEEFRWDKIKQKVSP